MTRADTLDPNPNHNPRSRHNVLVSLMCRFVRCGISSCQENTVIIDVYVSEPFSNALCLPLDPPSKLVACNYMFSWSSLCNNSSN